MPTNTTTTTNPFPPLSHGINHVAATIELFCADIGLGHDIQNCEVREGGNNSVIMFTYIPSTPSDPTHPPPSNTRQHCILRTRKQILINSLNATSEATKRIVAVMHTHGEAGPHPSPLPIPAILAYDETYDNMIRCPYIIQRKAEGNGLDIWYRILDDEGSASDQYHMKERLRIAEEMATFIASMEKNFRFGAYGVLVNGPGMLGKKIGLLEEEIEAKVRDPLVGNVQIPGELQHVDFIESLINARGEIAAAKFGCSSAEYRNLEKLREVFQQVRDGGLSDWYSGVATLWHPDLYPRNVVFDCVDAGAGADKEMKLTAVIDWDNAMVLPRIMTRKPLKWLWTYNDLPAEQNSVIREHFYTHMESLLPGYREEAEGKEARVVRAVYVYALWGTGYGYHSELSFEGLLREWDRMGVEEMF
ncbi:uncharacterized protein Bfra_003952 [Botrytis fragariae]|uniref:Aminoglycoside phosphotransferase domain-containing protein n=1 Tax=Botrytis fragariae TaxID=1964551 RepID=A0A8H6AXA0_9HELO|nr:uncharacterized protein Bfra_003952 [Botrytis fragariae]KAF5875498.1 hypothetical protein Bfra_003952 [Botrytis fragariae]